MHVYGAVEDLSIPLEYEKENKQYFRYFKNS